MTGVKNGGKSRSITWRTYTLDGRTLVVEQSPEEQWVVQCDDGPRKRGDDLAEAILAAAGLDELVPILPATRKAWAAWAHDHAAWIAADVDAKA